MIMSVHNGGAIVPREVVAGYGSARRYRPHGMAVSERLNGGGAPCTPHFLHLEKSNYKHSL